MLVLSRQKDEVIMIGDDIEVTVVDIRGDKVRLGVSAPREISVHRKEVYEAIRRENRTAAQVQPEALAGLGEAKPGDVPNRGTNGADGRTWGTADEAAAVAEGWNVFWQQTSAGVEWQIQRMDEAGVFADDGQAARHVQTRADEGGVLHRKAIEFLAAVGSPDVAKFGLSAARWEGAQQP